MHLHRIAPLVLFLLGGPAGSQEQATPRPRLVFEGLDGTRREVDPTGLSLEDPRARQAWLIRPVGYARTTPDVEADGEVARVQLADGDALIGRIAGGEGERLTLELIGGVSLPIDISQMREILLPEHLPPGQLDPLEQPEEGDRLYRRAGAELDRLDGTVESFGADGVRFESVLGRKSFPWSEVAALFVEVLDDSSSTPTGRTPVACDLVDGSRLRGELVRLEADTCHLSVAGSELAIDLSHVAEIAVVDGSLVFLSELTPVREEGKGAPFGDELGMVWPHRMDRNVADGPLQVGGKLWRRGIGMHAPSRIVWELDGAYASLRGTVGIDDSALWNPEDARGSVVFRLWTDGKMRWESGVVRGGDGTVDLPSIALEGARELVLEADMAGDFRGDRANWLRVLLVK